VHQLAEFLFSFLHLIGALILIISSGLVIWLSLRLIGKNRNLIQCSIANFASLIFSALITSLFTFSPFLLFSPIIFLFLYFYGLKALLNINFLEAVIVVILSSIVIFIAGILFEILFGKWLLFFIPKPRLLVHF